MKTVLHKADTRGHANHGWLDTYHSFSFASWYNPERIHFGALRVLNDDIVAAGKGFGLHPHDNMEIVTIMLDGTLEHRDSMGHTKQLHLNEVQAMSAGTGIHHAEYNASKTDSLNLLQIWIFPDTQNVEPRYDQRKFDPNGRQGKWQFLVAPKEAEEETSLWLHQSAWFARAELKSGENLEYKLHDENHGAYLFVIDGSIKIGDKELNRRDGLGISDLEMVNIEASEDADVLLIEVPMQV